MLCYIVAKCLYNIKFHNDTSLDRFELKVSATYWGRNLIQDVPFEGRVDFCQYNGRKITVNLSRDVEDD